MTGKPKSALAAFVPVIHKGYFDFFSGNPGDIYFFGDELIQEFVHLTRDLRNLGEPNVAKALTALFPGRKVAVLTQAVMNAWKYDLTVMPDDEVCREIAGKYLAGRPVDFKPVFLRWNKIITFKEHEIDPKRTITNDEFHKKIIGQALVAAQKSDDWWRQIAAVLVKDKKVILETYNHHMPTTFHLSTNGDPRSNFNAGEHNDIYTSIHAEAELIARAGRAGISLEGADLYASTFPCPNCARLIGTAGVKRVFYAKGYSLLDAEKILAHFGVEIIMVK